MKKALITGVSGQDGSYLIELLLESGYEVYGLERPGKQPTRALPPNVRMVAGDLTDQSSIDAAMGQVQPDEIYNLAAPSFVPRSWEDPITTAEIAGVGALRLLEAMRRICPTARFYQASSSEMFGDAESAPQDEQTPFRPRSPYGIAKVFAYQSVVNYRARYGLFACSGITFNHESPRRDLAFLPRKVTHQVARIKLGLSSKLLLGDLNARRDWGFAGDYVRAMWMILQRATPEDFVIATGIGHSVRDLVAAAFAVVGLDWQEHVETDPALVRAAERSILLGDPSKANQELGWRPKVNFEQLIQMMVESDLALLRGENQGAGSRAMAGRPEISSS